MAHNHGRCTSSLTCCRRYSLGVSPFQRTKIGRVYVPAQLANARAVAKGDKTWDAEIDGAPWTQQTFPYQAKCLRWTNELYRSLSEADRASVDALLEGTGVESMLSTD